MKINGWLTINYRGTMKVTKNKPSLEWNEISMFLNVELPDSLFKRPHLQANIKIDGELNHEFNYECQKNLTDVISSIPNIHLLSIDVKKMEDKK